MLERRGQSVLYLLSFKCACRTLEGCIASGHPVQLRLFYCNELTRTDNLQSPHMFLYLCYCYLPDARRRVEDDELFGQNVLERVDQHEFAILSPALCAVE